jgi:hypothetical protein
MADLTSDEDLAREALPCDGGRYDCWGPDEHHECRASKAWPRITAAIAKARREEVEAMPCDCDTFRRRCHKHSRLAELEVKPA